ncbi:hypothetical protein KM759_gp075 [Lymphocystis disease virus 4]|uniref:Uncharacterized protein n=1 Tax=Lymphocystis disease virus 4 TaxID=2704413 RepID=A0A6B9XJZ8_9VIRU|nr:hypothetical protein KM759_gp075 [Lymphocystis disease virus 4]QHR78545.1 hypothetical protein [Lymphocystis disease virus 4]
MNLFEYNQRLRIFNSILSKNSIKFEGRGNKLLILNELFESVTNKLTELANKQIITRPHQLRPCMINYEVDYDENILNEIIDRLVETDDFLKTVISTEAFFCLNKSETMSFWRSLNGCKLQLSTIIHE